MDPNKPTTSSHGANEQPGAESDGTAEDVRAALGVTEVIQTPPQPVILSNRAEPRHRYLQQLLLTGFTMASYFALGLISSQTSVSFLDLIHSVRSDIETGSLIFTLGSLGYMIGSVVGGALYDKFSKELIFGTCALVAGGMTVAVPWCPWVALMIAVVFIRSLFTGAMDSGGTVILLKVWGKAANPYMQALHFMFALGGVCSPLITEPFLMPIPADNQTQIPDILNTTFQFAAETYTSSITADDMVSDETAAGETPPVVLPYTGHVTVDSVSTVSAFPPEFQVLRVYIPHIIVGAFTILTAAPFFAMVLVGRQRGDSQDPAQSDDVEKREETPKAPWFYFVLFAMYFFPYGCTEECYSAFLMPFVVKYLHWEKSAGAGANSVYWGSFAGGRFIGIFIAKCVNVRNMILGDFILVIVGLLGFLFAAGKSDAVIWACDVIVGLATASVFASSVTWLDQNLTRISGKVAGFLVVSMSVGTMSNTALLGYLFEKHSKMWFVYLMLGNTSVSLIVFILMYFLQRHFNKKNQHTSQNGNMELEITSRQ